DRGDGGIRLPLVPTRDIVVFPHMLVPLFLGRGKSIRAIEEAVAKNKLVFLATQRDAKVNDPRTEDIHPVGTVARVEQLLHLPDGSVKVAVSSERRGRIVRYTEQADLFRVEIEEIEEHCERTGEIEMLMRKVQSAFEVYAYLNKKVP